MSPYVGIFPFLLSLLLYITVAPIVLLLLLINELSRLCVSIYLKFKYNGEIFLISSGNDAMFSGQIPGKTRMVIMGYRSKGKLEKEELSNIFKNVAAEVDENGNLTNKRMEYLITQKFGYGCWQIDPNYNINNHIRTIDDKVYNKADVQKMLKELSSDMDPSRPEWDIILLPRYWDEGDETETSWALARFNHTYMDGLSTIMFMERFFCSNFTYYLNPMTFEIASWKRFLFYFNSIIFAPSMIVYGYMDSYKALWPVLEIPKGRKMERNFVWTADLNKESINKIRKVADNSTISAVVQNAFIAATLQTLPSKRVPEKWLIADLAALLPYKRFIPQNRFTAFTYEIDSLEDDFTRLKSTKKAAWDGMIGPQIPLGYFVFKRIGRMPEFMRTWTLSRMSSSLFFSNVPISKTSFKVTDSEVLEAIGFPPTPNNTGISLCCTTYLNAVKIGCAAQSNWLRKEELDDIMKKVPAIIEDWAMKAEELKLKQN